MRDSYRREDRQPDVEAAIRHLERAREHLRMGASRALRQARQGLDELGDEYASPEVDDDTGLKVLMAEDMASRGNEREAAEILMRVLEERLKLCQRHRGNYSSED
jgi:predicted metal-dependent hydrolase